MSKPITYWADMPAVRSLCSIYGPRWNKMPLYERTAILTALSAGINSAVTNKGESLAKITQQLLGNINPSHPSLYALLQQLDGELGNLQDALYLVAGIAMSAPLKGLKVV